MAKPEGLHFDAAKRPLYFISAFLGIAPYDIVTILLDHFISQSS